MTWPDPSHPGVGHLSSWLRPGSDRGHELKGKLRTIRRRTARWRRGRIIDVSIWRCWKFCESQVVLVNNHFSFEQNNFVRPLTTHHLLFFFRILRESISDLYLGLQGDSGSFAITLKNVFRLLILTRAS